MNARLNAIEGERRCYSRMRLHALSALRNVGITPSHGMYKDQRAPDAGRLSYRVALLGEDDYFQRLADVEAFAADYRLWKQTQAQPVAMRIVFVAWRTEPLSRVLALVTAGLWSEEQEAARTAYTVTHVPLVIAPCRWPGRQYPTDGCWRGRRCARRTR